MKAAKPFSLYVALAVLHASLFGRSGNENCLLGMIFSVVLYTIQIFAPIIRAGKGEI